MSSFISHSKAWLIAALAILGIEATYYALRQPSQLERTNFLQFSFATPETPQRLFTYHKLVEFGDARPTIVQAGDSSGFYGIEPRRIMAQLPPGNTYVNMSCCANLGFRGYYNILQFMLERNESIRYIVLYFTAYTMPSSPLWDGDGAQLWADASLKVFGGDVWREFLSPWRYFHVPTLAARRTVSEFVYYRNGRYRPRNAPLLQNIDYMHFLTVYRDTLGWMPEWDVRGGVYRVECQLPAHDFFDWTTLSRRTYLQDVLETYAALARRHNVTLVVAFQPTACIRGTGAGTAWARGVIERFRAANPDVEIPFDIDESWPSERFSVPAHVTRELSPTVTDRLARALAAIMARREPAGEGRIATGR